MNQKIRVTIFNEHNQEIINKERGIMRKISSLKSFYNYFFRTEKLKTNPAALVQLPKLHEKEIIRLEIDEVAKLLDEDAVLHTQAKLTQNTDKKTVE